MKTLAFLNKEVRLLFLGDKSIWSFPSVSSLSDYSICGRLNFIHLQCWEVLPFLSIQHQRCIKCRVFRAQDFYTPLALNCQKGQHLPALEVYKNQSPNLEVLKAILALQS